MPERGPVQLLLLFFHSRLRPGWRMGTVTVAIALIGLLLGELGIFHQARMELRQLLRQAAWQQALANEPKRKPWPWDDAVPIASRVVPRLGLSAAVDFDRSRQGFEPQLSPGSPRTSVLIDRRDPHLAQNDLAVGDRIIVTTADGQAQAYRVTDWRVVDAETSSLGQDASSGSCPTLKSTMAGALRVIIEAIHLDPRAKQATSEQKL